MAAQTSMIPVDKCVVPPIRITAVYDDETAQLLHDSLEATGQIVPIVVIESEGLFYVADGMHRLEEAKDRGDAEISAVVRPGDLKEVLFLNLVTNRTRGKVKASEMVVVIADLYLTHGVQIEELVTRTGFSQTYIERLIAIAEASPSVVEALDREIIGVGAAYELSRLPAWIQQDEVVAKQAIWRYPVAELRKFVGDVLEKMEELEGVEPKQRAERAVIVPTCDICKEEHDARDLKPVAACPGCFSIAWRAAKERHEQRTEAGKGGTE